MISQWLTWIKIQAPNPVLTEWRGWYTEEILSIYWIIIIIYNYIEIMKIAGR